MADLAFLLPNGMQSFTDNNGFPLAGGTVGMYIPATESFKDTWQDAAEMVVNTNPIILDGSGRALIYGSGNYRQIVKDADGNTIWDAETAADTATVVATSTTLALNDRADLQAATVSSNVDVVELAGYASYNDRGAGNYVRLGSTPSPVQPWHVQSADGTYWQLNIVGRVNPFQLGAKADNSTNDATAFQNMIDYGQTFSLGVDIPDGQYVLGSQINQTIPISVTSDPAARLRWTSSVSSGWLCDFRSATSNPGLTAINLPQLNSSAIDSSFDYPGYPSSWTGSARLGSAFTLWGGSRLNVNIQYIVGWENGLNIASTVDGTNGARSPQNIDINVNTIDLCVNGIFLDAGPTGASLGLGPISIAANTVFAKYPIHLGDSVNPIVACNVQITGQAFTNEANGSIIFSDGTFANNCNFDVNWCYAGFQSDSPTGTSTTLTNPLLSGSSSSNGQTTDGNSTLGYFGGGNNNFSFGWATDLAGFPGGEFPIAGIVTRIRDVGAYNQMNVRYYQYQQTSASLMSQTQGESNFGGGVGAAGVSRRITVSAPVPSLTNNSSAILYFYHTWLSKGNIKALQIFDPTGALTASGLRCVPGDNSANNNREGLLNFENSTGSTVAPATYTLFIEVVD